MEINLLYLIITLSVVAFLSTYTSHIFFTFNLKKILLPITINLLIISTFFILLYINKIDFITFTCMLALLSTVEFFILKRDTFKLLIFVLKSFYIFLLAFIITYSSYEIITNKNIFFINSYAISTPLFMLALALYIAFEYWFYKNMQLDKFNYIFNSINIFIPITIFALLIGKNYSFFYILIFSKHSTLISILFLVSILVELFFNVIMIYGISKSYHLSFYKHKNKILSVQYDLQVSNLTRITNHHEAIRKISHDLLNHKIVLHNLIKDMEYEKALTYIEELGYVVNNKSFKLLTSNNILNSLLINKEDICLQNNINILIDIELPKYFGISDFDICIIVGNLLDNAIEASLLLKESHQKIIMVKAKIINNNFVLEIKNNFNGLVTANKNKLFTRKKDTINHGIGLTNVQSVIDKYNGTLTLNYTNKEFTSLITTPVD